MRRVIIVAPSFSPASNPPTQRVRFFARHLPQYGWAPVVLSVQPEFYEEPIDPDMDALVPQDLTVIRTRAFSSRFTRPFGVGDLGIRAYWHLDRALRSICERQAPDLIYIPGPPWHPFRLGPAMLSAYGIPYVIDYIDPWVNSMGADGRWWTKAYWYRRLATVLEPTAARRAAHLVGVSTGTLDGVRSNYPDIAADRCTAIPYGVEPTDFAALRARPRPNPFWATDDGMLHLACVGAMLPQGYETLRAVFAAVARLRASCPALGNRMRLHFVGTTYEPIPRASLVLPVAKEFGLTDVVTEHPARVPYLDALNVNCLADVILALGSSEAHYTASKIYPIIFARRPILAVFHAESSVCDVMRRVNADGLVTYDDHARAESRVTEIARMLERLLTPGVDNVSHVRWNEAEEFTAAAVTKRLASVFDQCVSTASEPAEPTDTSRPVTVLSV